MKHDAEHHCLIIRKGWLFPQDLSIPDDQVIRNDADGIYLKLTALDLQSGVYNIPTTPVPQFAPSPAASPLARPTISISTSELGSETPPTQQGEGLDAKDAQLTTEPPQQSGKVRPERSVVFIVHGRDWGAKEATARLVEGQYLEAVILAEQPNGGRTLIEKFEAYAASAVFAIVLLTPDDIGGLATAPNDVQARARENVIFELGYFVGQLGRDKVCLVRRGEVNILSDLHGVAFIPLDEHDAWKGRVLREMDHAGIPIDMSRLHF